MLAATMPRGLSHICRHRGRAPARFNQSPESGTVESTLEYHDIEYIKNRLLEQFWS
jgi:hypothetical protein